MYAVGKLGSYISRGVVSVAAPFHPFGGAVDIVVVQQEDGSFKSSPWYVQFGKFQGVLKAREKVVSINVNGVDADFRMYLDSRGGAYFLRESDGDEGESGSWGDSAESMSSLRRPKKIMSCNYDLERSKLVSEFETGKVVTRSSSTGPRILGFVFGRSSGKENDSQREDAIGRERESSLERAEMAADLLEVKWSTSLATRKQKKGSISSNSDQQSSPNGNIQTSASVNNATGSKPDSSTPPHPNGDINYEGDDIPLSIAPVNYMESFTLEEKHFEVNAVSECVVGSNADKFERSEEQASDAGCKTKVVEPSADCEISVDGSNRATDDLHFTCSVSGKTDDHNLTSEVKPEISSSILSSETDKNVENIEDKNPCISVDGPKSDAVTPDDVETVLETKLKVTIERGPVKVVEEVIVDQVASDQEPSIPSDLLIEEATTAALDLMDNLTLEKHVISPHSDSLVTNGAVSETSEKFLSSDHAHFAFSDLDESEARSTTATPLDSPEAGNSLQSFTGEVIQESLPNDHSSSLEISRTASNPVNIAGTRQQSDQIAQTVDSFSSSWSHGVDMNPQDVNQSISRSLDSSFDNMLLVQGDVPKVPEKGTHEQQSTPRKSSLEQYQNSDELRKLLSDPAVEISLCRHLLHEGMGYEAAAQTFDTEKVEVEKFVSLGPDVIKNDKVVVRIGGLYFPWDAALPIVSAIGAPRGEQILEPKGMIIVDKVENTSQGDPQQSTDPGNGTWSLWPSKKTKSMDRRNSVVTDATCSQRSPAGNLDTLESDTMKKKLVRAKTPTSEQLASLNLREGKNEVTFTFSTSMLGEQKVDAQIYLWKYNARIVISDVDGTITKSDVLGQFMPMVGVDWSQTGVTHLFSAIKENGYELLFLSARAISQASITRQFLFNLKQDGKALPPGPVVISPDGLFPSLFREVIRRAPHEFKIACLEDIKALFPLDYNPFYAGFGNRDTDEVSYVKVGIPKGKIFIINPKGEVAVHRRVDTKSYTSLHTLVHEMFPHPDTVPPDEQEDFNSWNFWRLSPHMG